MHIYVGRLFLQVPMGALAILLWKHRGTCRTTFTKLTMVGLLCFRKNSISKMFV